MFARPLRPTPGRARRARATRPRPPGREPLPEGGTERNIVDTVRQTQHDLLAADDRVVILGEDVGPRGGVFRATDGLAAEFGAGRVLDTPLAESSIIGIGIGLALAGLRPIAEIQFADFIHSGFDQLVSEAARIHYRPNGDFQVPLVVRAPWGGGVHGALYHSQSIEATYAHVPGLKVVAPSTPADVAGLLREAIDDPDPVLFLEHKKTYRLIKGLVPDDAGWRVPIGVADVAREGDDLTVVTYGLHRHLASRRPRRWPRATARRSRSSTCARSPRSTRHGPDVGRPRPAGASSSTRTTSASAWAPRWPPSWPRRRSTTSTRRCAGWPPPTCPPSPSPAPLEAELFIDADKIADAIRASLRD